MMIGCDLNLGAFKANEIDLFSNSFSCYQEPKFQFLEHKVKRLSKNQYKNTLLSIFGSNIQQIISDKIALLPEDDISGSINSYQKHFSGAHINAFTTISDSIATHVSTNHNSYSLIRNTCFSTYVHGNDNDCLTEIVNKLGLSFFRYPISQSDTDWLKSVFLSGENKTDSLAQILKYFLQSPQFLYFIDDESNESLKPYRLASMLSYTIQDSPPDNQLMQLASSNQLNDVQIISEQIDRLLNSTLSKEKLSHFLNFWIDLNRISDLSSGPQNYLDGLNTGNLREDLIKEMHTYFKHIIFEKKGNYASLLLSTESFARTPASASIYGHEPATDSDPIKIMNSEKRMGLLLRAPLLFASTSETHPIVRGARFRANYLCDDMPLPTPDNLALGVDVNTTEMIMAHSNRERTDLKTSDTSCTGCHSFINPVGFAFEDFDTFGRVREQEVVYGSDGNVITTHAIDSSGSMPPMTNKDKIIHFRNAKSFVQQLAISPSAQQCFSKKIFQYYNLKESTSDDNCSISKINKSVSSNDGNILDGLKNMILSLSVGSNTNK